MKRLLDRRSCWLACLVAIGLAGLSPQAAAQGQFGRGTLHDRMTWEEIAEALGKYPPAFDSGLQRMFIMQSMDRLVDFQIQKLTAAQHVRLVDAVGFYRRRVEAGLDALERTCPAAAKPRKSPRYFAYGTGKRPANVRIIKFFSSSVVLATSQGAVAVDFAQGPVENQGEPETCDPYKTGFFLPRRQRDRLGQLVDVQLITHARHDHADYSLAKRLVAQHKPVVGPAELKTLWPDLAEGITVPDYEKVQAVGPCDIFTQLGALDVRGQSSDPLASDKAAQSVRYLIRMGGIVFLHSAENHADADGWLAKAQRLGWRVDVVFATGEYQGVVRTPRYLEGRNYFQIPVHEYDLEHDGGGNRTSGYYVGANFVRFTNHRLMPLLWGEDFLLTPQLARPGK